MNSILIGSSRAQQESIENSMVDLYLRLDLKGVGLLNFENHEAVVERGYEPPSRRSPSGLPRSPEQRVGG